VKCPAESSRELYWDGAADRPEGSKQVFIQCDAQNNGRTPARILEMRALLGIGPIGDPSKTWDEGLYKPSENAKTPRWVVLPNLRTALHYPIPGFASAVGQPLPTPPQGEAIFIHGVVRYWDMFSETNRFTQFCFRWNEGTPTKPAQFASAGGDQYNQQC